MTDDQTPPRRGRPPTGKALSGAERMRRVRSRGWRAVAYGETTTASDTALLEGLSDAYRRGAVATMEKIFGELVARAERRNTATVTDKDTDTDTATVTGKDTATVTDIDTATVTGKDTATVTDIDTATVTGKDTATVTDIDTATVTGKDTATVTDIDTATVTPRRRAKIDADIIGRVLALGHLSDRAAAAHLLAEGLRISPSSIGNIRKRSKDA